jgi:hypothetical protein
VLFYWSEIVRPEEDSDAWFATEVFASAVRRRKGETPAEDDST